MAVKQKKTSHSHSSNELLESPEALANRVTRSEEFLEKHKNVVFGIVLVIALILGGIYFYNYWQDRQSEQAQEEMFQAVFYFEGDELDKALNGDGNYPGFLQIIEDYGSTDAANLAHFYVGAIYLKQGEYQAAIDELNEFSADDLLVQARAYSLMGDAYMELGQYDDAANAYERAASHNENEYFTPYYLNKAALANELGGNTAAALENVTEIVEKYAASNEFENARKQKARLEAMQVK